MKSFKSLIHINNYFLKYFLLLITYTFQLKSVDAKLVFAMNIMRNIYEEQEAMLKNDGI